MIDGNTPSRVKRSSPVAIAALILALLSACDFFAPAPKPPALVPAIRLIGTPAQIGEDRALERSGFANVGGVDRPSFTVSKAFTMRPQCKKVEEQPGMVDCDLALHQCRRELCGAN